MTVEATVVVEVTSATEAVVVGPVTLQHEQALPYCAASEHCGLTYVGTAVSVAEAVTVRFVNSVNAETAEVGAVQAGGAVVTVTVTADSYSVTHIVLQVRVNEGLEDGKAGIPTRQPG